LESAKAREPAEWKMKSGALPVAFIGSITCITEEAARAKFTS